MFVNPDDAGKTELFVRKVAMDTNEKDIRALFEPYGELVKCKHLYNKNCAFVEFKEHAHAAKA